MENKSSLDGSTVGDGDRRRSRAGLRAVALNLLDDVVTLNNLACSRTAELAPKVEQTTGGDLPKTT